MTAQDTPVDAAASTAISTASTVMAAQNTPAVAAAISSKNTEMAAQDTPAAADHQLRKQRDSRSRHTRSRHNQLRKHRDRCTRHTRATISVDMMASAAASMGVS